MNWEGHTFGDSSLKSNTILYPTDNMSNRGIGPSKAPPKESLGGDIHLLSLAETLAIIRWWRLTTQDPDHWLLASTGLDRSLPPDPLPRYRFL